jgi:hypothetical protein
MPNPLVNLNDSLRLGVFHSEQTMPIGFGTVPSGSLLISLGDLVTDTAQPKVTRDAEPTTLEQSRLEVRESEQGSHRPQSPSESSAQRSSPGRTPLFRR